MVLVEQTTLVARAGERVVSEREDTDLVQAVRDGDDRAFEELYERYHSRIAAFVRPMVKDHQRTEDVTQEVFISALRRLRQTRAPIAFKPWLYEIARNACIDQHRRLRRAQEVPLGDELSNATSSAHAPTPHAALNAKEQIDDLRDAFAGLSPVQHEMLVMREFEGRSYRDIGERLNLTKPAVESALFRARRRLIQEYQDVATGTRCARVQRAIAATPAGRGPVRDGRIAMHISRCPACRDHARLRGVRFVGAPPRRAAGLLPLPLPLPGLLSHLPGAGWRARLAGLWSGRSDSVARWSASGADPTITGLVTAGAAVATVALAFGSSSVLGAHSSHTTVPAAARSAAATYPVRPRARPVGLMTPASSTPTPRHRVRHVRGRAGGAARARTAPAAVHRAGAALTSAASGASGVAPRRVGGRSSTGAPPPIASGLSLAGLKTPPLRLPSAGGPAVHLPAIGPGPSTDVMTATAGAALPSVTAVAPDVVGAAGAAVGAIDTTPLRSLNAGG